MAKMENGLFAKGRCSLENPGAHAWCISFGVRKCEVNWESSCMPIVRNYFHNGALHVVCSFCSLYIFLENFACALDAIPYHAFCNWPTGMYSTSSFHSGFIVFGCLKGFMFRRFKWVICICNCCGQLVLLFQMN